MNELKIRKWINKLLGSKKFRDSIEKACREIFTSKHVKK